ncbi:hypothetical protein FHETE_9001 [Fusarium heterosporum]|uniref:Uncharacterized protein n=1 Tax=Fusarium heterosporum TaxID=42747 RepID=A0A8H5SUY5_FUSHE|nr:hypothetical protein FHETE_9001 [Fusarium heterosporum]
MSSWETTALRLQGNATASSTPNSFHKSLPPLPKQIAKRRTTTKVKEVSPEDGCDRTRGWKPTSLSTPILLAVIALTLLLAIAVETIAQRSASQGGLALSPTLNDMPEYAKFSYLYVPTIIAVLYSMIWSWIDLDVKRMQPWFELSKRKGATAENSLFLDYQYEFVGSVPFKAAKQKHWPVFFGGTAMVMVFWLLTPLQSALLGTDVVPQIKNASIGIRSQLISVQEQASRLDPEFLNNGYAVGWLNQPFPPFMTPKYALLPFNIDDHPAPPGVKTNWTAETTKLSTELDCWPADVYNQKLRPATGREFLNGQGCNATLNMPTNMNFSMYYVGYYSNPYADYYLGSPHCLPTKNSTHQFLAVWAQGTKIPGELSQEYNITAVYCQPTYYKQQVLVNVESSTYEPDTAKIEALSSREILTDKEFNATAFEYVLANGVAEDVPVRDYPFTIVVEQHPRLNGTGLNMPVSNMVGYALAGKHAPMTAYSSHEALVEAYNSAHQYLFSLAVNQLLVNSTEISNHTATVDFYLTGVVVSRLFATCVESLLAAIALFTALILWLCRTSPSNLPMNPSSITRYIEIFRDSPDLLDSFSSMDNADEKSLLEDFRQDKVRLLLSQSNNSHVLIEKFIERSSDSRNRTHDSPKGYYDPIQPLALRKVSGLLFVMCLIGAIIGLSYLKQQEKALNGLQRPSQNFEVLQLLENYIPTIFATLIEPFWVLLTRLLCVLQPFRDLWKGKARPSHTIDAAYTSIPPQLVLWRALKLRHIILMLVCAMALLGNLLAVGMGSLFNEAPMIAEYPEELTPAYASKFDNESVSNFRQFLSSNLITSKLYEDQYYVTMANISSGTTLPPWVSRDYYFHRHKIDSIKRSRSGDVYNIQVRGYGARGNCTAMPARRLPLPKESSTSDTEEVTTEEDCPDLIDYANPMLRESGNNISSGQSAIEFCGTVRRNLGPQSCGRSLVMGWGRMPTPEDLNSTLDVSFIKCRPAFETAMFNLTVDLEGYVLSYNRTNELRATLDYPDSESHSDKIFQVTNDYWNSPKIQYHNDTTVRDWMNYLMMVQMNGSRAVVDPKAPVPDPQDLLPFVEDIYRRVFAIILSLNEQLFDHSEEEGETTAIRRTRETRIFMEDASFIISMTVLAINTVVAVLFYSRAVPSVLPRMPTTIGSVLAYVAPSRLVTPAFSLTHGNSTRTLSFGRYIGRDKDVHIGVEMDPHVVPVDPRSLKTRKRFLGQLLRRKPRPENQDIKSGTWL